MHFQPPVYLLSLSLIATLSHGKPVPQDVRVIGLTGTPEQICALSSENPSTWDNSGASVFLDNFIRTNGHMNWANGIDRTTTAGGAAADSNLDCADLLTGNCAAPTVQCALYTPPQLRFIRDAMSTCFRMLRAYHEELQDGIINEILNTGALVRDFGEPEQGFNIFGVLNGAFGIAAGVAAANPIVSGSLSALGGVFGILASGPDSTENAQIAINARLSAAFTESQNQVSRLTEAIFGGIDEPSLLARSVGSNGETTPVGRFFSGGRFLIPARVNLDMEVRNIVRAGISRIRQALVIRGLKSQGYFVFIDTDITTFEDCRPTGSRFMNGKCYKIVRNRTGITAFGVEDIPADKVLKFGDPSYNIVIEDFYNNAEACQNANPNGDGQTQSQGLPLDGSLPQCFFNMQVVTGKECISICGDAGICGFEIAPQCP
ncbi:hypothetical protein ABW20_dc0107940 [Dactylellina cionopaga]|nr:hypothetical protein ABW20_dc0107940 [Dactylellina cionopaga]